MNNATVTVALVVLFLAWACSVVARDAMDEFAAGTATAFTTFKLLFGSVSFVGLMIFLIVLVLLVFLEAYG